ncbi:hypothetical protein NQZ68_034901 [Dissostichus eleginoides]|nr:hypothetical protein NQZ68_034901 [Dissostichus eleginoides]
MDSNSLFYSLELVAGSGNTLNVEQRTALQTSLVILKKNYKFHRVLFWGKILGLKEDYFIAQGRGEDEMKDKKTLYSFNCMDWMLLAPATDSVIEEVSKTAKGRFVGDPSYVYEHVEIHRPGGRDDAIQEEEEVVTKVNEESRLAVTVHRIDEEASVVPRGAYLKSPHGLVQINRSFGGTYQSQESEEEIHPGNGDLNPAIDFLDVLSDDIPKGSWSLQLECASRVLVLRSLLWPGLTFFHLPTTPQHGHIYIGDGRKNLDLPFML